MLKNDSGSWMLNKSRLDARVSSFPTKNAACYLNVNRPEGLQHSKESCHNF